MRLHWPIFLCTRIARLSENNAEQKNHDHGDNRITEFGSKQLTEQYLSVNSDDTTPLAPIMARCLNPQIAQKPLPFKKTPIFTRIRGVRESPNFEARA